jgi:hypothetical protein
MLIALDYDGTYTADLLLWDEFIVMANGRGHKVVIATMRYSHEPIEVGCPVIYTERQAKLPYLNALGIKPDIWIDDNPHYLFEAGS